MIDYEIRCKIVNTEVMTLISSLTLNRTINYCIFFQSLIAVFRIEMNIHYLSENCKVEN